VTPAGALYAPPMKLAARLLVVVTLLGCSADDGPAAADAAVESRLPDAGTADLSTDPRPIQLPEDESPHSDPMEWWYYTGRLVAETGEVFGFELTVFQMLFSDKPIYAGHFTVTDPQAGEFFANMEVSAEDQRGLGEGFRLQTGQMEMSGHAGHDRIRARMKQAAIDLELVAAKPPVLQYGTGWMTVGSDRPFYYYSYTRMTARGSVTVGGVPRSVTGEAWMDHQWGTIGKGFGWDWFSLRLDDQSEVMLFYVRRDGKLGFVGGTLIDAKGEGRELKPGDFEARATGRWTSQQTGITYPCGWTVSVTPIQLEVTLAPVMKRQEFGLSLMGSPIYWEGLCDVTGTRAGKPASGHAYVEVTGNMK